MTKKRRRQKLKAALRAEGETRAGANATINAPYEENKPSVNAESEHNGTNGFTQAAHDDDQPHQGEPQQFDVAAQAIEDGTPQLQGKASDEDEVMLPPECRHYTAHDRFDGDMPFAVRKYWEQRYRIFSKYDEGIMMTDDAWFGITPEPVAVKIAAHLADSTPATTTTLIDAFCGAGGNTIAFALSGRWAKILAIERDPAVLACAMHNAAIYGVKDKIVWIEGDCFRILGNLLKRSGEVEDGEGAGDGDGDGVGTDGKGTAIFGSPPWGGPGYRDEEVFDLEGMQPYGLSTLWDAFRGEGRSVSLYLPRTSDLRQLAHLVGDQGSVDVVHYCVDGASKAICAYFGEDVQENG